MCAVCGVALLLDRISITSIVVRDVDAVLERMSCCIGKSTVSGAAGEGKGDTVCGSDVVWVLDNAGETEFAAGAGDDSASVTVRLSVDDDTGSESGRGERGGDGGGEGGGADGE